MTTNAFIFCWDCYGIEGIIPITQYEKWDQENTLSLLKGEKRTPNPLDRIIRNMVLRARYNTQRHYEIYAIDCDNSLDKDFWKEQWETNPQFTADLIRDRGHKIYSDRDDLNKRVIT